MKHADPSPEEALELEWSRFASDLALSLGTLEDREYLVISCINSPYYVQFAAQGGFGMRLEAVSNSYLPPNAVLDTDAFKLMEGMGWRRATETPERAQSSRRQIMGSPNFFVDANQPVPFDKVAVLAVITIRSVYHVKHPKGLEYKAFSRDKVEIRFPALRIRRAKKK